MYDYSADVLSDEWVPKKARKKIKLLVDENICDILVNQKMFSDVGNIIKNEVLYRTKIHPNN